MTTTVNQQPEPESLEAQIQRANNRASADDPSDPKPIQQSERIIEENQRSAERSPTAGDGYFDCETERRPEVIRGILREKQIGSLAAYYGIGKSPGLHDLTVHLIHGQPWCGRPIIKPRSVIAFDFESDPAEYKLNIRRSAERLDLPMPRFENDVWPYLQNDDPKKNSLTRDLLEALANPKSPAEARLALIRSALEKAPLGAVVFIDPVDMMFPIDKLKSQNILWLYREFRKILADFPQSLILGTWNLRKPNGNVPKASLLHDPRGWLFEVAGNLDLLNRCDV